MPNVTKKRPQKDAGGPEWKEFVAARGFPSDLDPEVRVYNYPDFGFNDELNGNKTSRTIWNLLYDHIQIYPKYERLKNIIRNMTHQKLLQIQ